MEQWKKCMNNVSYFWSCHQSHWIPSWQPYQGPYHQSLRPTHHLLSCAFSSSLFSSLSDMLSVSLPVVDKQYVYGLLNISMNISKKYIIFTQQSMSTLELLMVSYLCQLNRWVTHWNYQCDFTDWSRTIFAASYQVYGGTEVLFSQACCYHTQIHQTRQIANCILFRLSLSISHRHTHRYIN